MNRFRRVLASRAGAAVAGATAAAVLTATGLALAFDGSDLWVANGGGSVSYLATG